MTPPEPKRIYIAGPMTGYPDCNFAAFHAAARRLAAAGWAVSNPAENFGGCKGLPREEYLRLDLAALAQCDAIALLPAWEDSRGATLEHPDTRALGFLMSADSDMLLPPNNSAEFESLCLEVWRDLWHDNEARMNGRNGQPQAGVDIYGNADGQWVGIQCKQKSSLLWTALTVQELESEVNSAKTFRPHLGRFVLATSGPADCRVQQRARELTEEHQRLGLFSVSVWSWREIWQQLHRRPHLLQRLFPVFWPTQCRLLITHLARLMSPGCTIQDGTAVQQRQPSEDDSQASNAVHSPVSSFADRFLRSVSRSPVFLDMARQIQARRPHNDLPDRPTDFYQQMVRLLASGALLTDSSREPALGTGTIVAALPSLAWRLFEMNPRVVRYSLSELTDALVLTTDVSDARRFLDTLLEYGLLTASTSKAGAPVFEFTHLSVRDFLAASHIASLVNRDGWNKAKVHAGRFTPDRGTIGVSELLDARAFEPDWEPLVVLVAGMLDDPVSLLLMLADRHKDDHYRHRLGLLCRCYGALGTEQQGDVASRIGSIFDEVLRIARRCEHDDAGHRKPWLDWSEILLASSAGAERLCSGLLRLHGRYHGWAVSSQVLRLFDRVLAQSRVTSSVVDEIANVGLRDEHQCGVNTARLALALATHAHKETLVLRFAALLETRELPDRVKVRLAEAVATAGREDLSRSAGETLIALAQSDSLDWENSERAINGLVALLDTSLGAIAAPLLVYHLLNPSSRHHFWLAWRIIRKADQEPDNRWSALLLGITLRADREDDRRLKLWSAQVLSKHPHAELRDIGLRTLLGMVKERESHSWVHAARWLMENGPPEFAEQAQTGLLAEASSLESHHRLVATAELLDMGAIGPDGGPIRETVHEAVLREIKEHGDKYGSRLHVTAPGAPKGNVDLELLADNPNVVIRLMHTFNGPSFYLPDADDPNEKEERMRHWNAKLLHGTRYWPEVVRCSLHALASGADPDREGALGVVLYAATSSVLLNLLQKHMRPGRSAATTRHYLLDELYKRGWRLRFRGRRVEVLRQGDDVGRTMES